MSDNWYIKPIFELDFWRRRLNQAHAQGRKVHAAIYDVDDDAWARIQAESKEILQKHLKAGDRVLDAGCACGHLLDCVRMLPQGETIKYRGIDLSPDFIDVARYRHPRDDFEVGDLRDLPYKANAFDWALVRSVSGMVTENAGGGAWEKMRQELFRVAPRLLIFGYEEPSLHPEVHRRPGT